MTKPPLKRPPTSGTRKGNGAGKGDGWGGAKNGVGKGPPLQKFEPGNQVAVGRAPPNWGALTTKAEKAEALKQNLFRLGMSAERQETQVSAATAWLNREEGMPVARSVNLNVNDLSQLDDDALARQQQELERAIRSASEGTASEADKDEP